MINKKSILASLIICSLFTAFTFEAFHTGHEAECHKDDCPVCIVLQIIHNSEKINLNVVSTSVELSLSFTINGIILSVLLLAPATLIKQKVKLVI